MSLPSSLKPVLRVGTQDVIHYEPDWIEAAVAIAADKAGHHQWWLAEDVAQSLLRYLTNRCPRKIVTLGEIYEKLELTLRYMGFGDIASNLVITAPPIRMDLSEIATEAEGDATRLFILLNDRLESALATGTELVQCFGLQEAAGKFELGDSAAESDFPEQIVDFLRTALCMRFERLKNKSVALSIR